jgi:predicted DsbA family dithiol-disulfide isomerase
MATHGLEPPGAAGALVVDVVSDLICPWCFVAKRRLERMGSLVGRPVAVRWHPFQLNPDMRIEGKNRREYRSAKFGSWEYSQQLDRQVALAGRQVGIEFRHDLMQRTPNTLRGHVLLAAAAKDGLEVQNEVAERMFAGYFTRGEDVGDPNVLVAIAGECGIQGISEAKDLDNPVLVEEVEKEERANREAGVRGVPLISYQGQFLASGAQREELLAATLSELIANTGQCSDGVCTL